MGHILGHRPPLSPPDGYSWRRLVADVLEQEKLSLKRLAAMLADELGETPETVRKGLTRLPDGKTGTAGKYGDLVLRRFPVVHQAEAIGRQLGQYHGPAADLPARVRQDWIALHDRPPFSQTAAAGWVTVARAGLAIWRQEFELATAELAKIVLCKASPALAAEVLSVRAFVQARSQRSATQQTLDEFKALLDARGGDMPVDELTSYQARWADQQAYELYKPRDPGQADLAAALQLYQQIPVAAEGFAQVRRELGMSVVTLRMGRADEALAHARIAAEVSGDFAMVRLRAQALRQQARCLAALGDPAGGKPLEARAIAIADRLGDGNLAERLGGGASGVARRKLA